MHVLVFNKQTCLPLSTLSVEATVKEILKVKKKKSDEVSCYFVTQAFISKLHKKFFKDPSPTDCISFPIDGTEKTDYHILGEVFICANVAKDYALKHNKDPYQELTLYLVHGLLHLLGYDDIAPKDREEMRKQEDQLLCHLEKHSLLLHS